VQREILRFVATTGAKDRLVFVNPVQIDQWLSAIRTPRGSLLAQPSLEYGFFAGRRKLADMPFHATLYTPAPGRHVATVSYNIWFARLQYSPLRHRARGREQLNQESKLKVLERHL